MGLGVGLGAWQNDLGVVLPRSALISGPFAAFCNDLESFCAILQRFGAHSPENELIL